MITFDFKWCMHKKTTLSGGEDNYHTARQNQIKYDKNEHA